MSLSIPQPESDSSSGGDGLLEENFEDVDAKEGVVGGLWLCFEDSGLKEEDDDAEIGSVGREFRKSVVEVVEG